MVVIILHGWGHGKQYWEHIEKILKSYDSELRIYSLDLPGFGKEPLTKNIVGIPEYTLWLQDFIKNNKLNDIVVVGHSFGGRIAAEYASHSPKALKGLVLFGAPCIYRPSDNMRIRKLIYKFVKLFLPMSIRKLMYSSDARSITNERLFNVFRNIVHYDQTKQLTKINVKTLLLWGELDNEVPVSIAQEMQSLVEKSTLTLLPHVGHNAHMDNPTLFTGALYEYIKSI